jgi:hypothetical protein
MWSRFSMDEGWAAFPCLAGYDTALCGSPLSAEQAARADLDWLPCEREAVAMGSEIAEEAVDLRLHDADSPMGRMRGLIGWPAALAPR